MSSLIGAISKALVERMHRFSSEALRCFLPDLPGSVPGVFLDGPFARLRAVT
jgi:hypothetical protein